MKICSNGVYWNTRQEIDIGMILPFFFADSEGKVHPELYNVNGNPKYKYFYFDDKSVAETMKAAAKALSPASRGEELWTMT